MFPAAQRPTGLCSYCWWVGKHAMQVSSGSQRWPAVASGVQFVIQLCMPGVGAQGGRKKKLQASARVAVGSTLPSCCPALALSLTTAARAALLLLPLLLPLLLLLRAGSSAALQLPARWVRGRRNIPNGPRGVPGWRSAQMGTLLLCATASRLAQPSPTPRPPHPQPKARCWSPPLPVPWVVQPLVERPARCSKPSTSPSRTLPTLPTRCHLTFAPIRAILPPSLPSASCLFQAAGRSRKITRHADAAAAASWSDANTQQIGPFADRGPCQLRFHIDFIYAAAAPPALHRTRCRHHSRLPLPSRIAPQSHIGATMPSLCFEKTCPRCLSCLPYGDGLPNPLPTKPGHCNSHASRSEQHDFWSAWSTYPASCR